MLVNKCYLSACYRADYSDFIQVSVNNALFLLYLANLKNSDKIIARLKRQPHFNAVCRIHRIYEPSYPEFHPKILPHLQQQLLLQKISQSAIWLEAVKLTQGKESDIEQGYFALQDKYQFIYPYIENNPSLIIPGLNHQDKQQLITIHGTLNNNHAINPLRILSVEKATPHPSRQLTANIPPELQKFFN